MQVQDSITEQLYKNRESLETIFRIIDKDNSGMLSTTSISYDIAAD